MKKNVTWIACIICLMLSCNSNDNNNQEVSEETIQDTLSGVSNSTDSAITIVNRPLIWTVNQETSGAEKLKKPEEVRLDTFSSDHLIQLINSNYPDIHLDLIKISHDTMYVNIPESKKLTEEMGSTGSENYMASATYTLTELKNVKFVNFAMKQGDHAEPGVFSREDFKRLR